MQEKCNENALNINKLGTIWYRYLCLLKNGFQLNVSKSTKCLHSIIIIVPNFGTKTKNFK